MLIAISLGLRTGVDLFQQLRIEHGRADAIASARPLPQVDQTATVAAEGKVLVCAQHDCATGRTAQTQSFLAGHRSNDAHNEIVIVRFGNFTAIEVARIQPLMVPEIVDEDLSIDFRRMH